MCLGVHPGMAAACESNGKVNAGTQNNIGVLLCFFSAFVIAVVNLEKFHCAFGAGNLKCFFMNNFFYYKEIFLYIGIYVIRKYGSLAEGKFKNILLY